MNIRGLSWGNHFVQTRTKPARSRFSWNRYNRNGPKTEPLLTPHRTDCQASQATSNSISNGMDMTMTKWPGNQPPISQKKSKCLMTRTNNTDWEKRRWNRTERTQNTQYLAISSCSHSVMELRTSGFIVLFSEGMSNILERTSRGERGNIDLRYGCVEHMSQNGECVYPYHCVDWL